VVPRNGAAAAAQLRRLRTAAVYARRKSAASESNGHFTFGSLSNPAKFTPKLLDAWAQILKRTEDSRLLLHFAGLAERDVQAPISSANDPALRKSSTPPEVGLRI